MRVFFYGLFMDEKLLAAKGIKPANPRVGFVDGYALIIGDRATLVRRPNGRSYGVLMDIASHEAAELYAEDSVADYVPEPVSVEFRDGTQVEATCYNLPGGAAHATNEVYAESLLKVAKRLGFPESYIDQIRQVGRSDPGFVNDQY